MTTPERAPFSPYCPLLLAVVASIVGGCSASRGAPQSGEDAGGGGASVASGAGGEGGAPTSSSSAGTAGGDGELNPDSVSAGAGGEQAPDEVFAQSATTLFRLEPTTKMVTTVGNFTNCGGSVIDIAVDARGVMFGTTFGGLYRIDTHTAACTFIASGSYPNSLSFVPKGTVDAESEALVGYVVATYTRIDTTTGEQTAIGSLGEGYSSSGDVVSVIDGGTYLTVKGGSCNDCIVEVDPRTGAMRRMIGPLVHADVFGLAFWGGSAYGFDSHGQLFQIDLSDASSTNIAMPNAPAHLSFYGAGSSTAAPLVSPE